MFVVQNSFPGVSGFFKIGTLCAFHDLRTSAYVNKDRSSAKDLSFHHAGPKGEGGKAGEPRQGHFGQVEINSYKQTVLFTTILLSWILKKFLQKMAERLNIL